MTAELKEDEKSKVWLKEKELIAIRLGALSSKEIVFNVLDEIEKAAKQYPDIKNYIIDIGKFNFPPEVHTSFLRKKMASRVEEISNSINPKKSAIFCDNITRRTIISFVVAASGVKNIKVFKTENEALDWLKE